MLTGTSRILFPHHSSFTSFIHFLLSSLFSCFPSLSLSPILADNKLQTAFPFSFSSTVYLFIPIYQEQFPFIVAPRFLWHPLFYLNCPSAVSGAGALSSAAQLVEFLWLPSLLLLRLLLPPSLVSAISTHMSAVVYVQLVFIYLPVHSFTHSFIHLVANHWRPLLPRHCLFVASFPRPRIRPRPPRRPPPLHLLLMKLMKLMI